MVYEVIPVPPYPTPIVSAVQVPEVILPLASTLKALPVPLVSVPSKSALTVVVNEPVMSTESTKDRLPVLLAMLL